MNKKNIKRVITFIVIISATALLFIAIIKSLESLKNKDFWVEHTYKVVIETKKLLSSIQDAETGQRGYLLTEDKEYLTPYNQGIENTEKSFLTLEELTTVHNTEQKNLEELKRLINLKLKELKLTIDLTLNGKKDEALKIVQNNSGKKYMDDIRAFIEAFKEIEYQLLEQRTNEANNSFLMNQYLIFGLLTSLLILMVIIYRVVLNKKQLEIENKQQEITLLEQSKMVAMGEMIGNIAHQWRQPLSVITTAASGLKFKYATEGRVTQEDFNEFSDGIVKNAKFLSETINTFIDFVKNEKVVVYIPIQEEISQALNLIDATLKNNYIQLKDNIDYSNDLVIQIKKGELPQVLINILNNAKDVIKEREIENAWIEINLLKENSKITITIEDNAGGIPKNILPKIFEPYFTTKHQFQGTGLGLNMSYQIVTKSLKGKLFVRNTDNGAKFFIELPLESK